MAVAMIVVHFFISVLSRTSARALIQTNLFQLVYFVRTHTLSWSSREAGAVITLQPLMGVTWQLVSTGLTLLPSTHLAAPTAVYHQRHSDRTRWHSGWALTWPRTQLAPHLKWEGQNNSCCLCCHSITCFAFCFSVTTTTVNSFHCIYFLLKKYFQWKLFTVRYLAPVE